MRVAALVIGMLTLGGVAYLGYSPAAGGVVADAGAPAASGALVVPYYIAEGAAETGFAASDRKLARWAIEAWARQTDPAIELVEAGEDEAAIRVLWVRADEGLYGETRTRIVDGRPVADVYVRPDLRGLGADIEGAAGHDPLFRDTVVYLTCVHEIGHAFGLPHTASFADIMYTFQYGGDFVGYFRRFRDRLSTFEDIRTTSPFSAADIEAMRVAVR